MLIRTFPEGNNLGKEIHGIMVDKTLDYGTQEDTPRIKDAQGVVFTGNALNSGRDDGAGLYSPDYRIVVKNPESSIVKDNVQHLGALKQLAVDLGQHGESVIIQDNVGTLRKL